MTAPGLAVGADIGLVRSPRQFVRWVIVLMGAGAAGTSVGFALSRNQLAEPGLQAALVNWITLPYVVAGVLSWSRRPDSRFGPLMVAAGFAMFLSCLQWSSASVPYTIGLAFDLLPAALFLHLFLAFQSGRLKLRLERGSPASSFLGDEFVWIGSFPRPKE